MHNLVYLENRLCPIILGHTCSWKILKLSDFMFYRVEEHPNLLFYRVEEHVHEVVYQENRLCPMMLGHICGWKILKMSDFMILLGGGTCG